MAYPRGITSPTVRGSQGTHAAGSHLCEGQLEEKEEAAVGHSNLETQQKLGCNMWQSLPWCKQEQITCFPAMFLSEGLSKM